MSNIEEAVPGRSALAEIPDDGIHFTTFGAALGVGFLLAMLLPVVPLAVLLVAAWGMIAGLGRTARPGWRRVPFTRWRLAYSPLDGMLWTAAMGMLLLVAIGVTLGGRP